MPSKQRRRKVGGAEDVEPPAEQAAGDAVESAKVPGDLGAVDGEVGGDGATEALGGKERSVWGRVGGDGLGCDGSVGRLISKECVFREGER